METDDANTAKTLTEGDGPDGSSLSLEPVKPQTLNDGLGPALDPDGVRDSAGNVEDLNGDISSGDGDGDGDGDGVVIRRRIAETEVTVERIFGAEDEVDLGCEEENENRSDSALGMDKDVAPSVNGSEKSGGSENVNGSVDENCKVVEGRSNNAQEVSEAKLGDDKVQLQEVDSNKDDDDGEDFSDMGDKHGYRVGDFVWGKIKSHPWWPGQIYDPSDASAYATKLKQKDRLLVAYFGDGSFSWCHSSQLRPFVEDFEEMSTQSTSKHFVNAVEKALDAISRIVESEMTCSCIPEGNQVVVTKPVNAGIKTEANVPEGGAVKLLIAQHGPAELLAIVRNIGRVNSFNSLLQFIVLKSWLGSFYRARGGYKLCSYTEPRYIEGLEDIKNGEKDGTEFGEPVEVPIRVSLEEDWLEKSPQKRPQVPEDKLYQRRKQKSVADLMREDMDLMSTVKETRSGKSASATKKSKVSDEIGTKIEDRTVLTPLGEKRGRKKKKAEVSRSPKTAETKVSSLENDGVKGEESNEIPLSMMKEKRKVNYETAGKDNTLKFSGSSKAKVSGGEKDEMKSNEEMVRSYAAREKKKSRYLSPPYTDIKRGIKNSSAKKVSETNSENVSDVSQIGARTTRAVSQLIGSPLILKCSDRTSEDGHPKEIGTGNNDALGIKSPKKARQDQMLNINSMEIDATPFELLYEVRSAAVNPLCLGVEKNLEMITGFFSAYRNSVFFNGSKDKEMYKKARSGRKRKSSNSEPGALEQSELLKSGSKQKKENGVKGHKSKKAKQAAKASSGGTEEPSAKKDSPALLVTFPPGFSLPSKDDIIKIFSKFGAVNEAETDVFYNSFCARLVFMKSSDAEEAFNISVEKNPFGAANVNFRLRYPSAAPRDQKIPSPLERTPDNPIPPQQLDTEALRLGFVKFKLDVIARMVENSGAKVAADLKSNLEGEMKELLEKVNGMIESIST
ncbi:hypothetical protein LguiA_019589 [Lonicera macranthoides]